MVQLHDYFYSNEATISRAMATMTATATAAAPATATATPTILRMIPHSYRAWQVSAHGMTVIAMKVIHHIELG